jgi:hypothetical protein
MGAGSQTPWYPEISRAGNLLQHGGDSRPIRRCRFERQPWRECGVTVRITPTGVVGGFVYRQGCRNPYSKIPASFKRKLLDVGTRRANHHGPSRALVQPLREKYFASRFARNTITDSRRPASLCKRGVSQSSRTWSAGCGGRFGAFDESRMKRTAKSCGLDASTLASSRRMRLAHIAGDGDKKARSPERARRKPLKPLRGECRVKPV